MSSQKKQQQSTNNGINYIDSLPVEILCMVFDRLDLANVKKASLVSKGWNNIIFFSGYVGRFVYTIDACCYMGSLEHYQNLANMELALTKDAISIAMHSQRCYRHLKCVMKRLDDPALPSLWEPLYTQSRWTNNLRSLSFSFAYPCDLTELLPSIADATSKMPILHSLTLDNSDGFGFKLCNETILRSSSVKHLEIRNIYKIGIDIPQLQTLKCQFSNIANPANIAQSHALGNLKHISLTEEKDYYFWENLTKTELSLIRRLTELETFELINYCIPICIRTFIAILKTFTRLTAVSFDIPYSRTRILSNPNGVWFDPGQSESPMHSGVS